ncbi:MAG TPA: Daple [Actinoplanes sp.]|jgi:hypothetical protein
MPTAGSSGSPAAPPSSSGFVDAPPDGQIPPSGDDYSAARWSEARPRYSDLLAHLSPPGGEPARPPAPRTEPTVPGLGDPGAITEVIRQPGFDAPTPSSAPPYPYEGDLEDVPARPSAPAQRAAVPMVRPAVPGRRADADPARHALTPTVQAAAETPHTRPSYDPASFPRRLPYEPVLPPEGSGYVPASTPGSPYVPPTSAPGSPYVPPTSAPGSPYVPPPAYTSFDQGPGAIDPRLVGPAERVLPRRVPAEPDVPKVPDPPSAEPPAETPALARIATHLRRGDVLPAQERQEGFDVQAILGAVREVAGVRDASLRTTPTGAHSLRLDLAEGADPAEVSRQVARLLQERMGLDAAMKGEVPPAFAGPQQPGPQQPGPQQPGPQQPGLQQLGPQQLGPQQLGPQQLGPQQLGPQQRSPQQPGQQQTRQAASVAAPVSPSAAMPSALSAAERRPVSGPPTTESLRAATEVQSRRVAEAESRRVAEVESRRVTEEHRRAAEQESRRAAVEAESRQAEAESRRAEARRSAEPHPAAVVEGTEVDHGPARPLYPGEHPGPRIVIENVHVNTYGTEAGVEVRLAVGARTAAGVANGPAVDGYLLRLCAMATAGAVDQLLADSAHPEGPARCFVEHAGAVQFGANQVAVVVLLLACDGWVEQLSGSAVVVGDDRHAMVRATLAAVNRRLEALLSR